MPAALPLTHCQQNHLQPWATDPHSSAVIFGPRSIRPYKVGRPPWKMTGPEKEKKRRLILKTEGWKSDDAVSSQWMRSSRPHVVLANLVDFSLSVLSLLIAKRWHLQHTRHSECPTVLLRARIPLMAQGQNGHGNSEEISGCARYEGRGVGSLLSGGICEPASRRKKKKRSGIVSYWWCQKGSAKLWRCKVVGEAQLGVD